MKENKNKPEDPKDNALGSYTKYTGMAFQMIAIIGVFTFIGFKIDENAKSVQPVYTAIFSLLGVFISLYQVIRSAKNIK